MYYIVPNGIATKKNAGVTSVTGITTTAHTTTVPHPVSLIRNAYTVSLPANNVKSATEAAPITGKFI